MTAPPHDGSVWIILPVHNRRPVTLRCLEHLRETGVRAWARAIVVDDGSSDGTGAAVRAAFPEVTVLDGNGELYWTGAIVLGMRHAVAQGVSCCVWLNDDSHPAHGAVERIVSHALAQGCLTAGLGRLVAGPVAQDFYALRKTRWGFTNRVAPADAGEMIDVDACRGNLVAVPRGVIDAIGYPDAENLPHFFADTDYSLRATAAGIRCVVDRGAVVEETLHSGSFGSWLTSRRPLRDIWARLRMKQASLYWRANWVYWRRHWGKVLGTLFFVKLYARLALISLVRLTVPYRWLKGRRPG